MHLLQYCGHVSQEREGETKGKYRDGHYETHKLLNKNVVAVQVSHKYSDKHVKQSSGHNSQIG